MFFLCDALDGPLIIVMLVCTQQSSPIFSSGKTNSYQRSKIIERKYQAGNPHRNPAESQGEKKMESKRKTTEESQNRRRNGRDNSSSDDNVESTELG
jgi:hypothetical protein